VLIAGLFDADAAMDQNKQLRRTVRDVGGAVQEATAPSLNNPREK